MGTFDSLLGLVKGAATDYFGDDADGVFRTVDGFASSNGDGGADGGWGRALSSFLGGDDGGADGGADGGWGRALSSFLGGGDGGADGGADGGWGRALSSFLGGDDGAASDGGIDGWDLFGRMVDGLSGDGGRDHLLDGAVDRLGSYLPGEVRGVAGALLGRDASSWTGSLVGARDADPTGAATSHLGPHDSAPGLPATTHVDGLDHGGHDGADAAAYDDLVTSGASAHGHGGPDRGFEVPDDPTFPDDIDVAPAPAPADDFHQAIDDADQVDESMDAMFEGLE